MSLDASGSTTGWVQLSIFYVCIPALPSDPSNVKFRAEVLYGEGRLGSERGQVPIRRENLGDGIHVLHLADTLEEVARRLAAPEFECRLRRNEDPVALFTFGFERRPPVVGLSGRTGAIDSPVPRVRRLHQFVRIEKAALLQRIATRNPKVALRPANATLEAFGRRTGCDLRGEHVQWLGDVVVFERLERAAWWTPVNAEDRKSCRAIDVHVRGEDSELIQVQVRVNGLDEMCLCDRLLEWRNGARAPQRVDLEEEVGSCFLRAWVDGHLALEEQCALLRGFSMRIDLVGATYTIRDRLTDKLEKAVSAGAATPGALVKAQTASSSALSTRTKTQMNGEPWEHLNHTRQAVLDFVTPPPDEYTFFPANPQERARAILHFAKLLSESTDAYLVDPWFDATGAAALLPRLRGHEHLTIITNLPSADHAEQKAKLVEFLRGATVMGLPEKLEVVCTHRANTEDQAFHDRWLLLRSEYQWRGFVLTNSFSGLATRYPLFVVEAPAATTALLLGETERLLEQSGLEHERLWPLPALPTIRTPAREESFRGWRALLSRLVPRRSRSDDEWLAAAQDSGFLFVREDKISWRMSANAREATLNQLLPKPAAQRPQGRSHGRGRGFAVERFREASAPFDVGTLRAPSRRTRREDWTSLPARSPVD